MEEGRGEERVQKEEKKEAIRREVKGEGENKI